MAEDVHLTCTKATNILKNSAIIAYILCENRLTSSTAKWIAVN